MCTTPRMLFHSLKYQCKATGTCIVIHTVVCTFHVRFPQPITITRSSDMQKQLDNYMNSPYSKVCTNMVKLLVTERCNLQCPFCTKAPPKVKELTIDEIANICEAFIKAGMKIIKISGGAYGEPLIRKDIVEVIKVAKAAGFSEIGIATNGHLLTPGLMNEMVSSGLTWITHSITTLNPTNYKSLYKSSLKQSSLDSVAKYPGLDRYQINCVLLKEHNQEDWEEIIEFAHSRGAMVHFMELIGHEDNWDYYKANFVDAEPLKAKLMDQCMVYQYKKLDMTHVYALPTGNVSVKQTTHERDACRVCRRMFVSSEGKLWFCLPENQLFDFRNADPKTLNITNLMDNRYNEITQKGEDQRLAHGCSRACDGCGRMIG
ncbi:radical SAM protein [Aquitalea sp. S1-19]|nr:radical SAM protein [Aquitalea sp. S1-19]